jgi:hypothetical protein
MSINGFGCDASDTPENLAAFGPRAVGGQDRSAFAKVWVVTVSDWQQLHGTALDSDDEAD